MGKLITVNFERWLRRQPAAAESRLTGRTGARFPEPDRARLGFMTTTILLVDDDPLQAYLCKALLDRRFPDVRRVADAAEAFCLVEQPQFAEGLGLVIVRDRLPGIGGPAFVVELHSRMPDLPVLVLGTELEWPTESKGEHVRFVSAEKDSGEILEAAAQLLAAGTTVSGSRVA